MKYSSKPLSQMLTQLCLAKGIDHIVISPGSRNAPLTIGFTENPDFKTFSIVDERCAAFFALGMAQQLKRPVAVVCTSGSALLNYYPAVAEAFYSDIPLVVISADRPEDLLEIGDGQTINQKNVYDNHILYSANCEEGENTFVFNEKEINIALNTAIELNGPVHINVPFSEPLYEKEETLFAAPQNVLARRVPEKFNEDVSEFSSRWNASKRKIVLFGVMNPTEVDSKLLKKFAEDESVIVFTETTSNLHHPNFYPAIDQLLFSMEEEQFKELQPDILLTFGGMVVSKRVKKFLREFSPNEHWHVDTKKAYDTYFCLSKHFKTTANQFLEVFSKEIETVSSEYRPHWDKVKYYRLERQKEFELQAPYSDYSVYEHLLHNLPKDIQLQVANSAAIRYTQLFELDESIDVFCNRGTSGIDGSTSTAVGAAFASKKQTVFITGDLSFFYDSNALWNQYIPKNFRVIIVNNGGGGIFRILPNAKNSDKFEQYFETKHNLTAQHLSEMYGFEYQKVDSIEILKESLEGFYDFSEGPKILEVFTPATENDVVLKAYFKFIK